MKANDRWLTLAVIGSEMLISQSMVRKILFPNGPPNRKKLKRSRWLRGGGTKKKPWKVREDHFVMRWLRWWRRNLKKKGKGKRSSVIWCGYQAALLAHLHEVIKEELERALEERSMRFVPFARLDYKKHNELLGQVRQKAERRLQKVALRKLLEPELKAALRKDFTSHGARNAHGTTLLKPLDDHLRARIGRVKTAWLARIARLDKDAV